MVLKTIPLEPLSKRNLRNPRFKTARRTCASYVYFSFSFPLIVMQGTGVGGKGVCGIFKIVAHSLKTTGLDELEGLFQL